MCTIQNDIFHTPFFNCIFLATTYNVTKSHLFYLLDTASQCVNITFLIVNLDLCFILHSCRVKGYYFGLALSK